jgi:C-terminal processing protease CtpA/Prc
VPNPIVALPKVEGESAKGEVAGNVGFALMRQFAVTYDLPNDALYFERYLNFGAPDIADRGGLWIERSDDGFKVIDVVSDGPAAAAGLKAGDVIVEVNGYPVRAAPAAGRAEKCYVHRLAPGSSSRRPTATK